ncbi:bifunctional phosphopantothenoylcysteine decarboxylase/phosphopantothenate--cysteine ligase CoaBC [Pararhizobium mangrovi]|uniref:Coenzyme A biosynthesis bifunctional protein CoaBC n=1 Tax=Pararhizobium mangrovi TaxID=2590452 RepID=A0A506TYN4_9HYPH|nr:bifunctional phosphopantothenoylcysteine decarboxylase/phosphopantothenate--cysteine ligase CoaBC [Pararhizobium mangrovi]TPW26091.1 bifunctional phosphopantothenoylcysteine decarboxylase/phosphopantothenate--cysteine ligase CoaBC [Pararhizobium mangrovi]
MAKELEGRRILLVIGGGIAAYKSLDLIRRLAERGATVRVVMTAGAQAFVTPLAAGALAGGRVYSELFSREDEQDVGHIRLAREADAIVVAPATADRMARMAAGMADDLAGAVLLAARVPVLLAPAMNPAMWAHSATRRNRERLAADGIAFVGPDAGEMAERGEAGTGRMSEPAEIADALAALLSPGEKPLAGRRAVVTAGPTHEPIDPVRYIANRSSGRQGFAIAEALAGLGADVTLVAGPVSLADPPGVSTVHVERAEEMLAAVRAALPVDIAVMVAAVADWRVESDTPQKIKKREGEAVPSLTLAENPDILKTIATGTPRPAFVAGFAAETEHVIEHARAKLARKGADLIVANDVSAEGGAMGGVRNTVHLVDANGTQSWPEMSKAEIAARLAEVIAKRLDAPTT